MASHKKILLHLHSTCIPAPQRGKTSKQNLFNGKTLVNSAKDAYRLTWPFLVFGALLIGLYVNDYRDFDSMNEVLKYTKMGQRTLAQSSRVSYIMNYLVLRSVSGPYTYYARLACTATLLCHDHHLRVCLQQGISAHWFQVITLTCGLDRASRIMLAPLYFL